MKTTNTPAPTAHTAGPWQIEEVTTGRGRVTKWRVWSDGSGMGVSDSDYVPPFSVTVLDEQTARLIAAAPDMAVALQEITDRFEAICPDADGAIDKHDRKLIASARSALARARGE